MSDHAYEAAAIRHLMTLYGQRLDELNEGAQSDANTNPKKTKKIRYDFSGTLASTASISSSLIESYRLKLDYELYDVKLFPVRPLKHEKRDQSWRVSKAAAHVPVQQWIAAIDTDGYFHIFNQLGEDLFKTATAPSSFRVANRHVTSNIIAIDQSDQDKQIFVLSSVDGTLLIIETNIDAYKVGQSITYQHHIKQLLKTKISSKHKNAFITSGTVYKSKEIFDVFVGDNHGRIMHYYYRFASKKKGDATSTQFEFVYEHFLDPLEVSPVTTIMKYANTLAIAAGSNVYFMNKETMQLSEYTLRANNTVTDLVFDNTFHNIYLRLANGEISIYKLIANGRQTAKNVKDAKPVKTLSFISATSPIMSKNTTFTVGSISKFKDHIVSSSNCDINFYNAKRLASLTSLSGVVNTDLCYFYHPKYDTQYPGVSNRFGFGGIVIDSSFINYKPAQQSAGSLIAKALSVKPFKGNVVFAHNNRKLNGTNEILNAINFARGDFYKGSTIILYRTTSQSGRDGDQGFASTIIDTLKPFTFLIGLLVIFLLRFTMKKGKQSGVVSKNMDMLLRDPKKKELLDKIAAITETTKGLKEANNTTQVDGNVDEVPLDNNTPVSTESARATVPVGGKDEATWKHRNSVFTNGVSDTQENIKSE